MTESIDMSLHVRSSRPGSISDPGSTGEAGGGAGDDPAGAARPVLRLGAEPAGGLTLPDAMPTPGQLYAPRGVWLDDRRLVACDTGNHRILIWDLDFDDGSPSIADHCDAQIVLGQADFCSEGAQAAGRGPERGLRLPTGVLIHQGRLIVADAWNHRILIWDEVPTESDRAPDVVLGQPNATEVDENRGGPCGPLGFYWPFGIAMVGDTFYVADTGNRRVLAWNAVPGPDDLPDLVLGQPSADSRDENRGELGPNSFRWPHDIAANEEAVFIADAGNHRILGWKPEPRSDRPADTVLGQTDFVSGAEFPYAPQTATALRFPYAIDIDSDSDSDSDSHGDGDGDGGGGGDRPGGLDDAEIMAVADTANNRILIWDGVPLDSTVPADRVLGQPSFAANGENRWDAVRADTFCWPYGLSLHRRRLAVADSGNNRITLWNLG